MDLYQVEVTSAARKEIRALPGNMRQRIIDLLKELRSSPRPHNTKLMDMSELGDEVSQNMELYRIRVESWRVVYAIEEELKLLTVLGVRKRPPYQYDDLRELIEELMGNEE
ncbi:type II toxin-antitoxin system RelE/ParE family toxin [Microseira sp. BLCC-F43]|jgi:mRNA interferase RelE/StbE|uniref:type II toxin-antitoxin system RelE family toxin n=1 Tax=Microseira sp. BLCC-F43 TaxID=3153602 RepID=UPI0035BAAB95